MRLFWVLLRIRPLQDFPIYFLENENGIISRNCSESLHSFLAPVGSLQAVSSAAGERPGHPRGPDCWRVSDSQRRESAGHSGAGWAGEAGLEICFHV